MSKEFDNSIMSVELGIFGSIKLDVTDDGIGRLLHLRIDTTKATYFDNDVAWVTVYQQDLEDLITALEYARLVIIKNDKGKGS